jgi:hypothetical protein
LAKPVVIIDEISDKSKKTIRDWVEGLRQVSSNDCESEIYVGNVLLGDGGSLREPGQGRGEYISA